MANVGEIKVLRLDHIFEVAVLLAMKSFENHVT